VRRSAGRLRGFGRGFRRDESGFVLVFLAVAVPALIGLVALALDGVRFLTLDTELAQMADAAALAAASRLDRSTGAIPRAREAALALTNGPAPDRPGARLRFRFAAGLDPLRGSATYTLSDDAGAEAAFVEVTTAETSLTVSLLQIVGVRATPIRRRAIAESQHYACDVTPLVLCQADPGAFVATARPGRQYLLRMDGNLVDGSVALLDRPDSTGARDAMRDLASDEPAFCYADAVRLRTNVAPLEFDEAVNVRFDRYAGRTGPIPADIAFYPPAPNVIQGRHLDTCQSVPQGGEIWPPYSLPRDQAYRGITLSGLWNQGATDWRTSPAIGGTGVPFATALDEYLAWNHADKGPVVQDRLRSAPTRYDLYLRELGLTRETDTSPVDTRGLGPARATMPTGGPSAGSLALRRENAIPVCYPGSRPAVQARRRLLYLSVADCGAFPATATAARLSQQVAKVFLTEPVDAGAMLVEFVGMMKPTADDGKLRHIVQLVGAE